MGTVHQYANENFRRESIQTIEQTEDKDAVEELQCDVTVELLREMLPCKHSCKRACPMRQSSSGQVEYFRLKETAKQLLQQALSSRFHRSAFCTFKPLAGLEFLALNVLSPIKEF